MSRNVFGKPVPANVVQAGDSRNRKVPVDSSDIDFAIVRSANKRPGHASRTATGVEILAKGEVKTLSDKLTRLMWHYHENRV